MDKPSANALAIIGPQQPKADKADKPLPLDDQRMDAADAVTIDLTAYETWIEQPAPGAAEEPSQRPSVGGFLFNKLSPLAASIALATVLGILAGTAATLTFMPAQTAAPAIATLSDEARDLQERFAKLSGEVAAVKAGLEIATRSATTQLGRIGERLDRAEKAQAEPAARLAKIMESLERLERRTASAALPAPDVTGSVTTVEKQQAKPPVLEGWRLHDFYAGRAVIQSRTGTLYEVGPGSMLPGIGRIETIRRVDGKIVVTTPKGTITSSALEPPQRPAYRLPPGYY
jgi:hypothetical protein